MMNANGTGILYVDFHVDEETMNVTTNENFSLVRQAVESGCYVVARMSSNDSVVFLSILNAGPIEDSEKGVYYAILFGSAIGAQIEYSADGAVYLMIGA